MGKAWSSVLVPRRSIIRAASVAWIGVGAGGALQTAEAAADQDESELIQRFAGGPAAESPRVQLKIPAVFSNGYSVPLTLLVDSPMTDADHVRSILVLAPKNPIVPVVRFRFTPASGQARLSTRIRLAGSQSVVAVAEMSDGKLLMNRTSVTVDIDGCK